MLSLKKTPWGILTSALLVIQDEKAQLLMTYIWLNSVSTAVSHLNFSVSDVGMIVE